MKIYTLYGLIFLCALIFSVIITPIMRKIALKFNIFDHPLNKIKTHKNPVPYLGGLAIWFSIILSMVLLRLFTNFPTGTLRSLRGILFGSLLIVLLGLIDDLHLKGINFKIKFIFQFVAAFILIYFGIKIKFIAPEYMGWIFTFIWIVGITNAFNIVDVVDGLSSGIAIIASCAFLFISLPTEELYVNFTAIILCGACLGFIPYNLSKKYKIFLGDTGSLLIGFILCALSLGTSYTSINNIAIFAPILILALPLYDTILVSFLRISKGKSPFLGSKDHFALRMEFLGMSRLKVLIISLLVSILLSICAFVSTKVNQIGSLIIYSIVITFFIFGTKYLLKLRIE
ncbi:MAG: MraY family glycosyltransferase [bacterium]